MKRRKQLTLQEKWEIDSKQILEGIRRKKVGLSIEERKRWGLKEVEIREVSEEELKKLLRS